MNRDVTPEAPPAKNVFRSPSRRSLVRGTAWAVPAVAMASAAPAFAASPVPSIGASAYVTKDCTNIQPTNNHMTVIYDSRPKINASDAPTQGFWIRNGKAALVTSKACRTIFIPAKYGVLTWQYADALAADRHWSIPTHDAASDRTINGIAYYAYKSCYDLTGTAGWTDHTGGAYGPYTIATYGGYFKVDIPTASAQDCTTGSNAFTWCGQRDVIYGGQALTYSACRSM